jgi:hypothetical protein
MEEGGSLVPSLSAGDRAMSMKLPERRHDPLFIAGREVERGMIVRWLRMHLRLNRNAQEFADDLEAGVHEKWDLARGAEVSNREK